MRGDFLRRMFPLLVCATLIALAWLPVSGEENGSIELREFSRAEVVEALEALGITEKPKVFQRLPDAKGVRITLSSGSVVEIGCDGSIANREGRGRITYFDHDGTPVAWYEGQELKFAQRSADPDLGNQISMDPSGRFLVTTDDRPGQETLVYSVEDLANPIGTVPVAGIRTRIYSGNRRLLVIGDEPNVDKQSVLVIAYEVGPRGLVEIERIGVPRPDVWFDGWLIAEDAKPDTTEVAFILWRDSPFSYKLYEFSVDERKLRETAKLRGYAAYVACNPFAPRESR